MNQVAIAIASTICAALTVLGTLITSIKFFIWFKDYRRKRQTPQIDAEEAVESLELASARVLNVANQPQLVPASTTIVPPEATTAIRPGALMFQIDAKEVAKLALASARDVASRPEPLTTPTTTVHPRASPAPSTTATVRPMTR